MKPVASCFFGNLRALGAALAVMVWAHGPGHAAEAMTVDEVRATAIGLLKDNQPREALALAHALLERDPEDASAWIIASRAERNLGRSRDARISAQKAWSKAQDPDLKYNAALIRAQALSSDGAMSRAQIWLRRASHLAETDAQRARAVEDFRFVRSQNPWRTDVNLSFAPTSNVNNGSQHDTISFAGLQGVQLGGAAQALSGFETELRLDTRYRLSQKERSRTEVLLRLSHRTYALSDEAQAQAPGVKGSDFAYSEAGLGLTHLFRPFETLGPFEARIETGWSWYAHEPFARFNRIGGRHRIPTGPRSFVEIALAAERFAFEGTDISADTVTGALTHVQQVGKNGTLQVRLRLGDSDSEASTYDYETVDLGMVWATGADWRGATPTFDLKLQDRVYERFPYTLDGRRDDSFEAGLEVAFRDIDYMGFVPTLRVSHRQTVSTEDRYDTRTSGVSFGFRSAF